MTPFTPVIVLVVSSSLLKLIYCLGQGDEPIEEEEDEEEEEPEEEEEKMQL